MLPADIRPDVMAAPFGLSGLVFGSEDSTATYTAISGNGINAKPPREFTRPVAIDGGTRDARFRTVTLDQSVTPYGRVYFCHHFTRDLVWRDEWRHHPNGVVAVQRVVIVHPDPTAAARVYSGMFGEAAVRPSVGGMMLIVGNTNVDIVTEEALRTEAWRCGSRCGGSIDLHGGADIPHHIDCANRTRARGKWRGRYQRSGGRRHGAGVIGAQRDARVSSSNPPSLSRRRGRPAGRRSGGLS